MQGTGARMSSCYVWTMSLFQAYLLKESTQKALSRKIGEKGFSLIELVVVIAVLAALAAIALPNFLGISDDASVRAAQSAGINYFKECQATWARGKRTTAEVFNNGAAPDISEFGIFSYAAGVPVATASIPTATAQDTQCFVTGPAKKDMWMLPTVNGKFPKFVVRQNGIRECAVGLQGTYPDTYNIGCSASGAWE